MRAHFSEAAASAHYPHPQRSLLYEGASCAKSRQPENKNNNQPREGLVLDPRATGARCQHCRRWDLFKSVSLFLLRLKRQRDRCNSVKLGVVPAKLSMRSFAVANLSYLLVAYVRRHGKRSTHDQRIIV